MVWKGATLRLLVKLGAGTPWWSCPWTPPTDKAESPDATLWQSMQHQNYVDRVIELGHNKGDLKGILNLISQV